MLGALDVVTVGIPHVGYGRMGESICEALTDRVELRSDASRVLFCLAPHMVKGWWEGQEAAVLTMWETTKMPPKYVHSVRQFDRLFVPCDWNAELFAPYHSDIEVVPLGIDVDFWCPQKVADNEVFRFVTGGSGWNRKGIGKVIEAFQAARLPDAELIVKVTPDLVDDPGSYDFGPDVQVIKRKLSLEDERALYASADCFVSGSRGEGFGMIPLQNAALGNLIIAPAHTGHLMFSDVFDFPLSWHYGKAEIQHFRDVGDWFDPDFGEMVDAMRCAYQMGRPSLFERQMRWERVEGWSWDSTADRLLEVFPPGGVIKKKKWVPAGSDLVEVLTLQKVEADVGDYRLRFPAGEVVQVPTSTLLHLVDCGLVTEI